MGASSIMGSIEHESTRHDINENATFCLVLAYHCLLAEYDMPVSGAVTMMLMDIHFGTSFFNAAGGGDPVLFSIFYCLFFGLPEVYIMILPAFGIASHIIETFQEAAIWIFLNSLGNGFNCNFILLVWAHHMFGLPLAAELFFMWATMLIAVPTGVKVFASGYNYVQRVNYI